MMFKSITVFIVLICFSLNNYAIDCENNLFNYSLGPIRLGENNKSLDFFIQQASISQAVCYDETLYKNEPETLEKFKSLRSKNAFDSHNCVINGTFDNKTNNEIFDLFTKNSQKNMHIYALTDQSTGDIKKVVLTNSLNPNFAKESLNAEDKIELAGLTLMSTGLGILIERKAFKGQHDKLLHSNYGAAINIGANLASYVVVEELGLGNKLNLTKNQRKIVIMLTGTIVGALVGYGKERFYDYYHRDVHTYDPHFKGDMGATMLGGGALNPIMLTYSIKF